MMKENEIDILKNLAEKLEFEATKMALREIADRCAAGEYSIETCIDMVRKLFRASGHCDDSVRYIKFALDCIEANLVGKKEDACYDEMEKRGLSGLLKGSSDDVNIAVYFGPFTKL